MAAWTVLLLGLLGLCWQVGGHDSINYDNHTLLSLMPKNHHQLDAVHLFTVPSEDVEILKRSRDLNDTFDVLVPPHRRNYLLDFAKDFGLDVEVKQENYGRLFENVERSGRRSHRNSFNVFNYNSEKAIHDYLIHIAQTFPDLVQLETFGRSSQGRIMNLVKVSNNPSASNPIIFIEAGVHAREWVAPAMALYLIHRLTADPNAGKLMLNGVDWYIIPMTNPDGYEFSRSSQNNRLWRKTRSRTTRNDCYGVDGNRNYGYKWGVSGVSNNPCDKETYPGPQAFSEPETRIVRDSLHAYQDRIKLFISLHSYGQYLVYPWGYTGEFLPKEWKNLDRLGRKVSRAVEEAGGMPFRVMSAGKWYAAAGGSDDYAFGGVGIPYSYTMELTDGFEFQFPEKRLRIVLPQFYEGFKVFAAQIKTEYGS